MVYASDYGCETLKSYMAEFFIVFLIRGLENKEITVEVALNFADYAYALRPNQLEYQRIYRDFGLIGNF